MNVLLLARWFLMFVQFLIVVTAEDGTCRSGDVAGNLTAVLPTCPNDTFTFFCSVVGDSNGAIHWRVGKRECFLVHSTMRDPHPCGSGSPFIARTETGFETTGASYFTSTLSGIATSELNGTLVECFVQHPEDSGSNPGQPPCRNSENMVGNITLQIVGPDIVDISCHHLSNLYNENINVTVSWTLSSGNCADFYLINITTNAPQTPYGGFLKINTGNITWHELTGFMAGYEYNITIRGTCAGGQEGSESEPLPFTPKVPDAPAYCNCTVIYNQSSGMLQFINSTWNTVESAVDPCPGISGVIKLYKMDYQTNIVNINVSMCMNGRCSHTFEPPSNPPSSYDSVSVAAVNVVGVGAVRNCTTQTINTTNNHLTGGIVDLSSPNIAVLFCEFLSGFTGSARCRVQYGTDPTYMNLPYSAESTETGTAGNSVSVMLRERLNSSTDYYYTVSAVSGDITVTVLAEPFATPLYNCSPMDLWNQTITNANFSPSVGLLDDATQYPNCDNRSVGSAVFRDTTVNTATVAYYTGTTTGSRACFVCNIDSGYELTTDAGNVCDEGNDCEPNTTINERVCKSDATWSGSPITCVCTLPSLLKWHIILMVIGARFLVFGILIIVCRTLGYCWWRCKDAEHFEMSNCAKKVKILCMVLLVIGASFCGIGVVLWIAVGGVVDNHTNHDVCDTDWCRSRDGLIITAFVCSIIALLIACTFTVLVGCYRKKATGTFPGDKKRLLWLLICSLAVYYPGDVAAQFVAAPPTCPGDNLIFNCTVGDMNGVTLWRVGGSECVLVHNTPSDPHSCRSGSPFIASTGTGFGTNATNFTSTLKAIANSTLDGTLVECFGPAFSRGPGNLVGNSVLQILGPPFVSTLSCVGLSEDVSGAVNVTVSWTLSGGDSADFYLINITTNAPQLPYGGLLNITTVNVTQQELTGFIAGYEYNITVHGVTLDCGGLVGRESEFLTITPQGPSIIAALSCVGLSANVSGAVNVTVSWTLSDGDSADFYLINITTNAPQTPYRGLLNISTASVTQHELTGLMAGYQYHITVRGVNCGSQEGRESEPLTITPQVPASPTSNVCAVYKENRVLLIIENTWNEVNNVTVSKDCINGQNITASYELTYTTDSSTPIATCIVNGTECSNGTCHYELHSNTEDSRCRPQVSQFTGSVTVSLTARNIVGRSIAVSRRINGRNIDLEAFIDTTNLSSVFVECTFFQPGYTCTIDYGTDPSYTNLIYRDTSSTLDRTATINLSQSLRGDTTYYYIVSAVSSSQCVRVRGRFQTDENDDNPEGANVGGIVGGIAAAVVVVVVIVGILVAFVAVKHKRKKVKMKTNTEGPRQRNSHNSGHPRPTGLPAEDKARLQQKIDRLEEEKRTHEKRIQELENELRSVQAEDKARLQQKIDRLEEEKRTHEKRIQELENELKSVQSQLKEMKNELVKKMDENQAETKKLIQDMLENRELLVNQEKRKLQDEEDERRLQQEKEEMRRLKDEEEERRRKEEQSANLQSAARKGDAETLGSLLDQGADINIKYAKGRTLLHLAVEEGHEDTVKYLVQKGASIDTKDGDGTTPLELANKIDRTEIARYLEEAQTSTLGGQDKTQLYQAVNGAHVKEVKGEAKHYKKPLLIAARLGDMDAIQYHVDNGADINIRDMDGKTPLHIATTQGRKDVVQYLIHKKADVNIEDKYGRTPLDEATEGGHVEIKEMIRKANKERLQKD